MVKYIIVVLFFSILSLNGQAQRALPIKRDLKVEKIKLKYKNVYYIYATCNDTLYKIVSYYDRYVKHGEKLKEGRTYTLWIQSLLDFTWNGVKESNSINICAGYAGYHIRKEPDKNILDIYESRQLNGIRIIHKSDEQYEKMGLCPELGLDPFHIKRLRDESNGKFGVRDYDSTLVVIGLSNYEYENFPPIRKELTIKKINRKFKEVYIIDAICNGTKYTILSKVKDYRRIGKKIRIGKTYTLNIQSVCPRTINGKENLLQLDQGCYFANHYIRLRQKESIRQLFRCDELNGNRLY